MTSRAAGRHRRGLSPQRPQSVLLLEYPGGGGQPGLYLNSGIVPNGSRLFSPGPDPVFRAGPAFGAGPGGGRRALRAARARDRRTFAMALSAALVGVAAAAVFGSIAPLHSTWMTGSGQGAAGGHGTAGGRPPQASMSWSAAPMGSPSVQAAPQGPPRHPGGAVTSRRPRGHALAPRTSQETGTGPAVGTGPAASTVTGASTRTGASTVSRSSSGAASAKPKVLVRYLVDRQWPGGFEAQVQVVNDGTRPITDWQIVVALPGDAVTSVRNASGFVSNDILLLQPAEADQVVLPGGGTLNVTLVAEGTESVPAACAFNGIPCT